MAPSRTKRIRPMTLVEFMQRFGSEEDCAQFLFEKRWPEGWICPKCHSHKRYRIEKRGLWECAGCGRQTSVTCGTILHRTRTPLRLWFLAMFLLVTDKRGVSSVALGKQIGASQKKAWYMLHKLRRAMSEREGRYQLSGLVQLDEHFFGQPKEGGARYPDRSKTMVLAGLSLTGNGRPRYLRMTVVEKQDRAHIESAVGRIAAPGATLHTNGLRSFRSLSLHGYGHPTPPKRQKKQSHPVPWSRVAASNVRAALGGTYHGVRGKHIQAYLDECDYRFNRRFELHLLFDRMVTAVVTCPVFTYADITGRTAAKAGTA